MPLMTTRHNKEVGALIANAVGEMGANTVGEMRFQPTDIISLSYIDEDGKEITIPIKSPIIARYEYPSEAEGYSHIGKHRHG